jgi:hypothetical protein
MAPYVQASLSSLLCEADQWTRFASTPQEDYSVYFEPDDDNDDDDTDEDSSSTYAHHPSSLSAECVLIAASISQEKLAERLGIRL